MRVFACGFNAHGQLNPIYPLPLSHGQSLSTDGNGVEDGDDKTGGSKTGSSKERIQVPGDVVCWQEICGARGCRVVFAGWSESAGMLK